MTMSYGILWGYVVEREVAKRLQSPSQDLKSHFIKVLHHILDALVAKIGKHIQTYGVFQCMVT